MEKNSGRVCGICDRHFPSGKAMGGHLRSHLAILPVPPKPEIKNQALDNSADLTERPIQPASSLTNHPKKKHTQNFRSLKRNLSALANSNTTKESGSCSYPKNPTRKRSKCRRELIAAADAKAEPKQMSSILDTLRAEEAAWSLLKLSTDKWPESKKMKTQNMKEANKVEAIDGEDGRGGSLFQIDSQARFKCDRCGKMFRSYQALGGHKSSHKKKNLPQEGGYSEDDESDSNGDVVDQKVFQCSYCNRMFKSAQALGGHKKVHFSNIMVTNAHSSANELRGVLALPVDLNFSAPTEDEKVSNTHIESNVQ